MHQTNLMRCSGAREVWWHNPTGHRWVVDTDISGSVIAAAGPFAGDDWYRFVRGPVRLNDHSTAYVREHRRDFVRLTAEITAMPHYENDAPVGQSAQGVQP